jgi:hypothetical protein
VCIDGLHHRTSGLAADSGCRVATPALMLLPGAAATRPESPGWGQVGKGAIITTRGSCVMLPVMCLGLQHTRSHGPMLEWVCHQENNRRHWLAASLCHQKREHQQERVVSAPRDLRVVKARQASCAAGSTAGGPRCRRHTCCLVVGRAPAIFCPSTALRALSGASCSLLAAQAETQNLHTMALTIELVQMPAR